ncbi:MAG: hypothetical protein ACLQSR_03600 [Limisphaerales bacterium]
MKLAFSPSLFGGRTVRGTVLIIVLWIAIGLVSVALYFSNSMTYELRASDNRASGLASEMAVEGAARYMNYVLETYSTNGAVPQNTQYSVSAVPVGDSHFWLIGRDPSGNPATDPYFGLVDEASKLNVNYTGTNTLYNLPNMTLDLAQAIVDWRSTNGLGNWSSDYTGLGYEDKNEQFETVDELRLVYGITMDLLYGNDLNNNGVLDASEQKSGGTVVQPGLAEYLTVYTREPNFNVTTDTLLTNMNTATQTELRSLFQGLGVGNSTTLASQIYSNIHGTGGGGGGTSFGTGTCHGILDFCLRCKARGMSSADFAKIYPYITTTTNAYIRGRINFNTASEPVMVALFMGLGVDQSTAQSAAQTLISYRQQNANETNSVAWVIDALGTSGEVIQALVGGDYATAHSYQFTADIAALGPYGRGYRRVKFVFDTSDGYPKIIYRRDLSRLGWALGDKVRQTWLENVTQ